MKQSIALFIILLSRFVSGFSQENEQKQWGLNSDKDPCGNPRVVSQIYMWMGGRVVEVPDGESLIVKIKGRKKTVRLIGISAPEVDQQFGKEAREYLARMVQGKAVSILYDGFDTPRKKEIIAQVSTQKGINEEMLRAGLARFKRPSMKDDDYLDWYRECKYQKAEEEARVEKRGLWKEPSLTNKKQ